MLSPTIKCLFESLRGGEYAYFLRLKSWRDILAHVEGADDPLLSALFAELHFEDPSGSEEPPEACEKAGAVAVIDAWTESLCELREAYLKS